MDTQTNHISTNLFINQLKYTNIYGNFTQVLNHMLFTNGNGLDIVDGQPSTIMTIAGSAVPHSIMYGGSASPLDMKERFIDYQLEPDIARTIKTFPDLNYDEEYRDKLEAINQIEYTSIDDLLNPTAILNELNNTFNDYRDEPVLRLSNGYFKLQNITDTDELFKDVCIAFVKANIEYYTNSIKRITGGKFKSRNKVFDMDNIVNQCGIEGVVTRCDIEAVLECIQYDVKLLNIELERLNHYK